MSTMFAFWPFDFSCSGFVFMAFLILAWLIWSVASVAKDVVTSDAAKEIGANVLGDWLSSWFRK
jgi:hypothetical protein